MVIVHIHRVVDIQYLGYTDIKKKIHCLSEVKIELDNVNCTLLPKVFLWD